MRMHTRNGRGGGNLVGNGDNDLPYLVMHAVYPRRGCDRCLMLSSRTLLDGNVPLADGAPLRDASFSNRHLVDSSIFHRCD